MPVDEGDRMVGRGRPVGRGGAPVSATKCSYCVFVTGVRASSNSSTATSAAVCLRRRGRSRSRRRARRPVEARRGSTATTRKPTYGSRAAGCIGQARRAASSSGPLRYEPPRTAPSAVHSKTLPAMSSAPQGAAPAGCSPAGDGPADALPKVARVVSGSSSPHGQSRSSPPRAAASHSTSVGSRTPFAAQNASASARETYVSGTPSSPVTGVAADPEALDPDDPPRRLVLVRRIGAGRVDPHRERPGRDRHPVDQPGSRAASPSRRARPARRRPGACAGRSARRCSGSGRAAGSSTTRRRSGSGGRGRRRWTWAAGSIVTVYHLAGLHEDLRSKPSRKRSG